MAGSAQLKSDWNNTSITTTKTAKPNTGCSATASTRSVSLWAGGTALSSPLASQGARRSSRNA